MPLPAAIVLLICWHDLALATGISKSCDWSGSGLSRACQFQAPNMAICFHPFQLPVLGNLLLDLQMCYQLEIWSLT